MPVDSSDKSKYAYVSVDKLDDLYFSKFLRELWGVPANKIREYIAHFYPHPSTLELVEITQLYEILNKINKVKKGELAGLSDDDYEVLKYKHSRMWGKERQVVELSGRDGKAIEITDMSDEELERTLKNKLSSIATAIKKSKEAK